MNRFASETVADIYQWRFAKGVEQHLSVAAHKLLHPLVAACSLQDVDVYGPIYNWPKLPGRLGIWVEGKWYLTFEWIEGQGAFEIQLERR